MSVYVRTCPSAEKFNTGGSYCPIDPSKVKALILATKDLAIPFSATAESIKTALAARELVKCKVLDNCPYKAKEAAEMFCEYIGCDSVQVIGSKFVLFMQKKKDSKYDMKNLTLVEKK